MGLSGSLQFLNNVMSKIKRVWDLVLNTGCRSQLKQNVSSCKLKSREHLLGSVRLVWLGKRDLEVLSVGESLL